VEEMSNRKGLIFSLDAMLALTLVAMTAVVFVFSLNLSETEKNRLMEIKSEVRDSEALAFLNGKTTEELGLLPYDESTWTSTYLFAACEKTIEYDVNTSLVSQASINVNYLCKGVA
jgi:hypothetical protein